VKRVLIISEEEVRHLYVFGLQMKRPQKPCLISITLKTEISNASWAVRAFAHISGSGKSLFADTRSGADYQGWSKCKAVKGKHTKSSLYDKNLIWRMMCQCFYNSISTIYSLRIDYFCLSHLADRSVLVFGPYFPQAGVLVPIQVQDRLVPSF